MCVLVNSLSCEVLKLLVVLAFSFIFHNLLCFAYSVWGFQLYLAGGIGGYTLTLSSCKRKILKFLPLIAHTKANPLTKQGDAKKGQNERLLRTHRVLCVFLCAEVD